LNLRETIRGSSTAEFYRWLIRNTTLIRAQADPQPEEFFHIFVRELGQVVQFDALAKFDEAANRVQWYVSPGLQELARTCSEMEQEAAKSERLPYWVSTHQETIVLGTLDEETRFSASISILRQAGIQSLCAIPLSDPHRHLGSAVMVSIHRDAYSPEDVRFCTLVANQLAVAMDDAINFRASQRARERLELLLDLTNRVVSKLDLHDLLREISANIRRVMECDGVGITLPSPEDRKLRVYTLDFPEKPSDVGEGFEPEAEEKAGVEAIFQSGEPAILPRDKLEHELLWLRSSIQSVVRVPLKGDTGIVGVLTLGTRREGAFAADDLPFLSQIARQLAIAVENAVAFARVTDLKNRATKEKQYLEDENPQRDAVRRCRL
jgi:formate hydrogenlyase transcriptional activator